MCGIFGFFLPRGAKESGAALLPRALAALAHRGPDGRDSLTLAHGEHALGFAHTRLAILDLSPAGHQPMRGPGGELLILNGEIYNHLELRRPLEAAGVVFRGSSDTETLLHLLLRHGPAALERLTGMFALAYWDPAAGTLLLARDRFGKKPLYVVPYLGGWVFASEVRALLASGAAPRQLDPEGLAHWLARGSCHEPTTLLRDVASLPPGHLMTLGPGGAHQRRYWSLTLDTPPPDWKSRLEALLDDAVRVRLISDRPIGVFLSGGVDSSAIAAVAARHAPDALEAFTLTFSEAAWDEGERAAASARRLGLRHHTSHLSASEALASLDQALAAQDLPSHDGFNTWFIARAARQAGLVVALAGTGGDELFGGYRHFRRFHALLVLGAATRWFPPALRQALARGLSPALPPRAQKALTLAANGGDAAALYASLRGMFAPAARARLMPAAAALAPEPAPDGDPATQLARMELTGYLVDTQLRDIDAMSMAHALEVRSPLLDQRLVAAVLALPSELRAPRGGINKRLLVDLARLPHAPFRAAKQGFVLPWEAWLRGPLAAWSERHLAASTELAALDSAAVDALRQRFQRARGSSHAAQASRASRVLALIALVAWCQRHGVRGPPA